MVNEASNYAVTSEKLGIFPLHQRAQLLNSNISDRKQFQSLQNIN